jgi:hypothetical protein
MKLDEDFWLRELVPQKLKFVYRRQVAGNIQESIRSGNSNKLKKTLITVVSITSCTQTAIVTTEFGFLPTFVRQYRALGGRSRFQPQLFEACHQEWRRYIRPFRPSD